MELRMPPVSTPCVTGTYDLLLTNKMRQRWWNGMERCHSRDLWLFLWACACVSTCIRLPISHKGDFLTFLPSWFEQVTTTLWSAYRELLRNCNSRSNSPPPPNGTLRPTATKRWILSTTWGSLEEDLFLLIPLMRPQPGRHLDCCLVKTWAEQPIKPSWTPAWPMELEIIN